jgi:hypothetical protein
MKYSMLPFLGLEVDEIINISQLYKDYYHCCMPHEGQVHVTIIMHTHHLTNAGI